MVTGGFTTLVAVGAERVVDGALFAAAASGDEVRDYREATAGGDGTGTLTCGVVRAASGGGWVPG